MAFNPSKDLNAIQKILIEDAEILRLMDLANATNIDKAKRIIKRSQWSDLATNEKRLCIFFVPDRRIRNEAFLESTLEIDVHAPAIQDFKAWEIQERVKNLLHKKRVNKSYLYFNGQIGELPTSQGFFCCGSRFRFYKSI